MDVAALLAPIFGGSHTAGVIAHFVNGTVVFPIAYLLLGQRNLPGPGWLRGTSLRVFLTIEATVGNIYGHIHRAMCDSDFHDEMDRIKSDY
jgi:hypothetical protein